MDWLIKKRSQVILSILILLFSAKVISEFFRLFSGENPVVSSPLSVKWIILIGGYLILYGILLYTGMVSLWNPSLSTKWDSALRNKIPASGIFRWLAAIGILFFLSWLYLLSPLRPLLYFTFGSNWLHYPILAAVAQLFGLILSKEHSLWKDKKDWGASILLLLFHHILGPMFIFYPWSAIFLVFGASIGIIALYQSDGLRLIAEKLIEAIKRLANTKYLAEIIAIMAALAYLLQGLYAAFTFSSILDEGAYVFKGYLFAIGRYWPFQDYGPWTNKMPLSFLIPGYVQALFGPGLLTARMYSLVLQAIFLFSLWITARRLAGRWSGALVILTLACNPFLFTFYTLANSQVLVVTLLTVSLAFALGEERSTWQLVVGSILAGILFLTRENLAPYVACLLAYIFWQYGPRKGFIASAAAFGVILTVHLIYWPGILKIWSKWLPAFLTPFLDAWRYTGGGRFLWDANLSELTSISSLWLGVANHFIAFLGSLGLLFLWPDWRAWYKTTRFRTAIFLLLTFSLLTLMHGWVSLTDEYCVFCFSTYIAFFFPLGVLLLILIFPIVTKRPTAAMAIGFTLFVSALFAGMGFSARKSLTGLLSIKVASASGADPNFTALWAVLSSSTGLPYETLKNLIPILFGILLVLSVFLFLLFFHLSLAPQTRKTINYPQTAIIGILVYGLAFLSTTYYQGFADSCQANIINAHEVAGAQLQQTIPAGSTVYWIGESTVPLLYLDVNIFPAQINDGFSFRVGSDTAKALKYGYWNEEIAKNWQEKTDFLLIEERQKNSPLAAFIMSEKFVQIGTTNTLNPCQPDSFLNIYQKK
jgi:hypothetical protein